MVLTKEYRICMPLTVEEYQIGQLYMIARHSHEQSEGGEGVEVVENTTCEDPVHGKGQYTEKRIHLSRKEIDCRLCLAKKKKIVKLKLYILSFSRLPYWMQSFLPKLFYVTEKAWNYYPFTITGKYSFLLMGIGVHLYPNSAYLSRPNMRITMEALKITLAAFSKKDFPPDLAAPLMMPYCLNLDPEVMSDRVVEYLDIAYDEVNPKHYKEEERKVHLISKLHFQTIREILLLGHRQAFAWIDQWFGMSLSDVRAYEKRMQLETNTKVSSGFEMNDDTDQPTKLPECIPAADVGASSASQTPTTPNAPKTNKSWFSWS
ncbi:Cytoplasmic phosphatidylinositol transfer protein 1 [Blattella germanica]|nr:Cytoplasmic phosphatidylinositol transfer protein 1 [Blattella germanica]